MCALGECFGVLCTKLAPAVRLTTVYSSWRRWSLAPFGMVAASSDLCIVDHERGVLQVFVPRHCWVRRRPKQLVGTFPDRRTMPSAGNICLFHSASRRELMISGCFMLSLLFVCRTSRRWADTANRDSTIPFSLALIPLSASCLM